MSGLPQAHDALNASHASSLRLFQEINLKPLSPIETKEVITLGLNDIKDKTSVVVTVEEKAHDSISLFSEGYPHFVQQIAYSAFEYDTDNVISEQDVDASSLGEEGAIQIIGDRYYVQLFYKEINADSQREILSIMAEKWNTWITRVELKKKFGGKELTLNNGIKALREKGIIIPREGYKGQYRLQWASFAFWIKNHNKKTTRR